MAYILDESGFVTGTYDGPGHLANSTNIVPPENVQHPPRFVDGAWVLVPVPRTDKRISLLAFLNRFTSYERKHIRAAQKSDTNVDDFMQLMNAAPSIDLDLPDTQNDMAYLVSIDLITFDRANEIINTPVVDAERA